MPVSPGLRVGSGLKRNSPRDLPIPRASISRPSGRERIETSTMSMITGSVSCISRPSGRERIETRSATRHVGRVGRISRPSGRERIETI